MTELRATATAQTNTCSSGRIRTRMNLGLHHLLAASRFSARVGQIEQENSDQDFGAHWEEGFQNSLAVVTLAVASIESYANELYFEGSILSGSINAAAANELSEMIDGESIVKKFSVALSVLAGKNLDRGVSPVQNMEALIKLRNAIVHFRPEWLDKQDKHDKLSRILQHKFQPSPLLRNEPLFPLAWASHSATNWAVTTCINFLDYFFQESGTPSPLEQFRPQLTELLRSAA